MFFPDKDFGSVKEAQRTLEQNRNRIGSILEQSRGDAVSSFHKQVSTVVQLDHAVSKMPSIRINANKSMHSAGLKSALTDN